jgi:hypothetical protein
MKNILKTFKNILYHLNSLFVNKSNGELTLLIKIVSSPLVIFQIENQEIIFRGIKYYTHFMELHGKF